MKRLFDITASLLGLLALSPVLAIAMLAIRLDSQGSPLFAQARMGRAKRPFTLYKLRTMYQGTTHRPTHEVQHAAVTKLGRRLRRWKLDEFPQLFNVLIGDMSLVGPRPCLPTQTALIEARSRLGVFAVRPGITGLAQIQGVDMSDPERLAQIDAIYARNATFLGDLRLLLATVSGRGAGVDRVATPPLEQDPEKLADFSNKIIHPNEKKRA